MALLSSLLKLLNEAVTRIKSVDQFGNERDGTAVDGELNAAVRGRGQWVLVNVRVMVFRNGSQPDLFFIFN